MVQIPYYIKRRVFREKPCFRESPCYLNGLWTSVVSVCAFLGTNISQGTFEDDFPFPKVGYVIFLEVKINIKFQKNEPTPQK